MKSLITITNLVTNLKHIVKNVCILILIIIVKVNLILMILSILYHENYNFFKIFN